MAIERIYKQPASNPKWFDKTIQNLQDALGGLSWLSHVFGRCERLAKVVNGQRRYTPNVYRGRDEYILLTPDNTDLGNYCFFVMEEPQTVTKPSQMYRLRSPFSLVVWYDQRTIPNDADGRNTEAVKDDILRTIHDAWIKNGYVSVERIYERAENVFEGFSLDEVDNQFLMSPFAGLRLTGEIMVNEDCVSV